MSENETNNYEQERGLHNEEMRKKNNIMKKYYNNGYLLESQALRNGFGKMVRAINQTNPKYSFGKEKRFFTINKHDNLPYEHCSLEDEKYGNVNIGYHSRVSNKGRGSIGKSYHRLDSGQDFNDSNKNIKNINFISSANNATDYYYVPPPTHYYKYEKSPKWGFSKSKRSLYADKGKYEHYSLPYDKRIDDENISKTWRNHIIGGDIGLDDRFAENKKLAQNMKSPGPGRYNPKDIYFKYSHYPGGYMGMKLDSGEPIKHQNLRNELNSCFNSNEKMKRSVRNNRKFVFHNKIRFDFGKNNHLDNTYNFNMTREPNSFNKLMKTKKKDEMNNNVNKFFEQFKKKFSLNNH